MTDFKRADEKPIKRKYINVDLSMIDEAPTNRQERINLIMKTILEGQEKMGGYPLQKLMSRFVIVYGVTRKKIIEYMHDLENTGYIFIGNSLCIHPTKKGYDLERISDPN